MKIARWIGLMAAFLLIGLVCFRSLIIDKTLQVERSSLGGATKNPIKAGEVPSGLNVGDWQAIRKQIVRYRHRIQPATAGAYRAVNPGQQLKASFSGDGMWVEPQEGNCGWGCVWNGWERKSCPDLPFRNLGRF